MSDAGGLASLISALTAWVSTNAAWIITVSILYFLISLLAIRFIIIRMPYDYFIRGRHDPRGYAHPAAAIALRVGKNLLGAVVIIVGLVMSLPGIPGQGLLTLLIGLTLTDFPGKRRMELWFLRRRLIRSAINGLRENAGKPALLLPDARVPREEREGGGDA